MSTIRLLLGAATAVIASASARAQQPRADLVLQEARFRKIVQLAGDDALSKGVTSFHDAGSNFATIDCFKQLARRNASGPALRHGALRAGLGTRREAG